MTALFLESSTNNDGDILILGLIIQFFVGLIQVIGALIRTIHSLITKKSMKLLCIYWISVFLYFIILYYIDEISNLYSMIWFPAAWVIAIWYWIKIVFNKNFINNLKS